MRYGVDPAAASHGCTVYEAQDVAAEYGVFFDETGQITEAHVFTGETPDEPVEDR